MDNEVMTQGPVPRSSALAICSLVFGILSVAIIWLGILFSIPAIVCGHVARSQIKKNPKYLTGDGLALAGLIMGYISLGLVILFIMVIVVVSVLEAAGTF